MERKRPEDYNENYGRPFASQTARPPANRGRGDTYWVGADGGMPVPIPPRRLSFKEAITKAEDQIGFHEYSRQHHCYGILHDMCRAMAEVYMMSPTTKIKVNGEELEAGMVADVLEQVTTEMAEIRAEELRETIAGVTNIKAYLRRALYNKVFEFEAAEVKLEEQVKRDMGSFNTGDFFAAAVRKALEE
jgi:hypothetical protein